MNTLKKLISLAIFFIFSIITLTGFSTKMITNNQNILKKDLVNANVLFYSLNDMFLTDVRGQLEAIEGKNKDKIKFTFYDGKNDPTVEMKIADDLIQGNTDLLILHLPEKKEGIINEIVYKAKQKSIPVIILNTPPNNLDLIKSYKKSIIIKSDAEQSGILEGQILVDEWNTNKNLIDKNHDNIMQYIMLKGLPSSIETSIRTNNSLKTIRDAGIKTQELASVACNWDRKLAKEAVEALFLQYGPKIEVIISNNDAMAIGAIEALQLYSYNTGNKARTIEIVGIDALPEATDLIKKGYMLGTVTQDPKAIAETIYTVGMNLISGKSPTEGTNYKLNDTGVEIVIPMQEYKATSSSEAVQ